MADRPLPSPERDSVTTRDAGVSYIEILIAIVIIATVGAAVLTSVRMSVIGSATEREHSRAHQWLQSATEVLVNEIPWQDCDDGTDTKTAAELRTIYEDALRAKTSIKPYAWQAFQITVPTPVEFAGPGGAYGSVCEPAEDRQRVTIEVVSPTYDLIERVEVVKVP